MTLDEFLTLPLAKRVEWLRKREGSHDRLAEKLGTSRQMVISWEKGTEPKTYAAKLATVSGFPREAWLRRESETLAVETTLGLLRQLRDELQQQAEHAAVALESVAEGIARIEARLPDEDGQARRVR